MPRRRASYSGLHFEGEHVSIARFYPEGTILSNGLSKWAGAGGWRLGAFVFPETLRWLADTMAAVASETFTSTAAPIQYAAVEGFGASAAIDDYLRRVRRVLGALMRASRATLQAAGAALAEPRGGFYVFPDFTPLRERLNARGVCTSEVLCERALEQTGIAFLPGSAFGQPAHELSVRLACVDFDGTAALRAAGELSPGEVPDEAFLRRYCNPAHDAIARLCDWITA